jgi:uncharacterized protein YbcV (DUF1398 family)
MTPDQIATMRQVVQDSLAARITFPEVVRRLHGAGVERYHADLSRGENTYYLPDGRSHVEPLGDRDGATAGPFSAESVASAIKQVQCGQMTYPSFVREIKAAGCVGYSVHITGRRVHYFGRDGDLHTEPFPPAP